MIRIRVASGLGDSVYLRPIAEHFARRGERVIALSNYPQIFAGSPCEVEPFRRDRVDIAAHYVLRQANPGTTQWQDVCLVAGVTDPVPFAFAWERQNHGLIEGLRAKAAGRPIVLVHGGRTPMGRTDGFGRELLPRRDAFASVLDGMGGALLVEIGRDHAEYDLPHDVDLFGATSVSDLLDLFQACDGVVCQCSFAVPMAEVFDRPLLAVWSTAGLAARETWTRGVRPDKVLSKESSGYVVDSLDAEFLRDRGRAFMQTIAEATPCDSLA